ncbi:HAD-superfamily hydrolase, subfamily IA, partial [Pseudomonas savastanoi pv. nerii]
MAADCSLRTSPDGQPEFKKSNPMRPQTSFIFDLDGTLTDSVYQNVAAWKEALDAENIPLAMWRIHRKIGMSGGLIADSTT